MRASRPLDRVRSHSGMTNVVGALLGGEEIEQVSDAAPGGLDRSLIGLAELALELAEDLFDGVEAGAVGRQEQKMRPGLADGPSSAAPPNVGFR